MFLSMQVLPYGGNPYSEESPPSQYRPYGAQYSPYRPQYSEQPAFQRPEERIQLYDGRPNGYQPFGGFPQQPADDYQPNGNFQSPSRYQPYPVNYQPGPYQPPQGYQPAAAFQPPGYQQPAGYQPLGYPPANYQPARYQPADYQQALYQPLQGGALPLAANLPFLGNGQPFVQQPAGELHGNRLDKQVEHSPTHLKIKYLYTSWMGTHFSYVIVDLRTVNVFWYNFFFAVLWTHEFNNHLNL